MKMSTIENISHLDRSRDDVDSHLPESIDVVSKMTKRRSSIYTESTSDTCNSDESGNGHKLATASMPNESRRSGRMSSTSSSGRPLHKNERKTGKDVGKKILVDLISKEMMDTWTINDHDEKARDGLLTNMPACAYSSADLFYAMVNGDAVNVQNSSVTMVDGETIDLQQSGSSHMNNDSDPEPGDIEIDYDFDQTSFHNLVFSIPDEDEVDDGQVPLRDVESLTLCHSEDLAPNVSTSSATDDSEGLSMSEIEDIVLQNIPLDLRNMIPKEAWRKIFGRSQADETSMPRLDKAIQKIEIEDDGDSSVVSDISNLTDVTGRVIAEEGFVTNQKRGSLTSASGSESSDRISFRTQPASHRLVAPIPTPSKEQSKKVTFSKVMVRYYERILDINPSVTAGPAIGIGWRYKRGGVVHIDEWEMRKGESIRCANDLLLPSYVRESMLKESGFTQQDIAAAVRVIFKAKNQRKQTVMNLGSEAMEEAVESATRRVKSILSIGVMNGLIKKS
jgi:hypothetical protein